MFLTSSTPLTLASTDDLLIARRHIRTGIAASYVAVDSGSFAVYSGSFSLAGIGPHTVDTTAWIGRATRRRYEPSGPWWTILRPIRPAAFTPEPYQAAGEFCHDLGHLARAFARTRRPRQNASGLNLREYRYSRWGSPYGTTSACLGPPDRGVPRG